LSKSFQNSQTYNIHLPRGSHWDNEMPIQCTDRNARQLNYFYRSVTTSVGERNREPAKSRGLLTTRRRPRACTRETNNWGGRTTTTSDTQLSCFANWTGVVLILCLCGYASVNIASGRPASRLNTHQF